MCIRDSLKGGHLLGTNTQGADILAYLYGGLQVNMKAALFYPVSYTHLDVYKRQGQSRPAQNYNPPPMPPTNQPSNDFGDMDDEIPF